MKILRLFLIILLFSLLISGFTSCGLFTDDTCGVNGEMSMRIGTETHYYCSINALFRSNSIMFEENQQVLLINLFGYKFEDGVSSAEKRKASRVGLIERTVSKRLGVASVINKDFSVLSDELQSKITGTHEIMIQIPYDGAGVYRQNQVFVQLYNDDDLIYRYIPSNQGDNLSFNLSRFQINNLDQSDMEMPEYKGATEEELKLVKKVDIAGRLLGTITMDGESVNINSDMSFKTIIEIPEE
jgi:hypothetical protein